MLSAGQIPEIRLERLRFRAPELQRHVDMRRQQHYHDRQGTGSTVLRSTAFRVDICVEKHVFDRSSTITWHGGNREEDLREADASEARKLSASRRARKASGF